jgi:hypothetical protein
MAVLGLPFRDLGGRRGRRLDFSKSFGTPIGTLRDWERRRREPEGAAPSLLPAIDREPETLLRLLRVVA